MTVDREFQAWSDHEDPYALPVFVNITVYY